MQSPWILPTRPAVILAPMEGVTDAPMRQVISEYGGLSFCVSEFLRVCSDLFPAKVFHRHVPETSDACLTSAGTPVQLQILGSDEEAMALNAVRAVQLGFGAIDINFGCPAPQVNRNDGGASLLRYPERIRGIVSAVRKAVPSKIPVSAKLRLGWESPTDIFRNAEEAAAGGASWLTIHARTKIQGYAPPVHWGYIGEVRKKLRIPIIANGDIWTFEDFLRCRDQTQCEHFMMGRGALANPALTLEVSRELGLTTREFDPDMKKGEISAWLPLLKRFAEVSEPVSQGSLYTASRIKQWLKMAYLRKQFPLFEKVKQSKTVEEIFEILEIEMNSPEPSNRYSYDSFNSIQKPIQSSL